MAQELAFDEDVSFTFKEEHTLDDLVEAFCAFYEEATNSLWDNISKVDLVSGRFIVVEVENDMFFGGKGFGLLLFYTQGSGTGGASLITFAGNSTSMFANRPVDKIKELVRTFFSEKCQQLITVGSQTPLAPLEEGETGAEKAGISEQLSLGPITPLAFCRKCGSPIAIDNSSYCWSCGTKLQSRGMRKSIYYSEGTQGTSPQCDEVEYDRNCMICKLQMRDGELLAWCPRCGAPAHRIHMLEWLHVKATCPACGERLDTREVQGQLTAAHVRRPAQPRPGAGARIDGGGTPAKAKGQGRRKPYAQPGRKARVPGKT